MSNVRKEHWIAAVINLKANGLFRKLFSVAIALFMPFAHGVELKASSDIENPYSIVITTARGFANHQYKYLGLRLFSASSDNSCGNYDDASMKAVEIIGNTGVLSYNKETIKVQGWLGTEHMQTDVSDFNMAHFNGGTLQIKLKNTTTKDITTYIGDYYFATPDTWFYQDETGCSVFQSITIPSQKVCNAIVNDINANINTASTSHIRYPFINNASTGASLSIIPSSICNGLQS